MAFDHHKISQLIQQIDLLLNRIHQRAQQNRASVEAVREHYRPSALNLLHYLGFRDGDLRDLQNQLRDLGLTRFANAAGHVEASLLNTRFVLQKITDQTGAVVPEPSLSIGRGMYMLQERTVALLGPQVSDRRVRIMVTLPREAANNQLLIERMAGAGMNCARINCAHDDPEIWKQMIDNIRATSSSTGVPITVAMDLAGPKIRTGSIVEGPRVRKFSPARDDAGRILKPTMIRLVPDVDYQPDSRSLPVDPGWLHRLMYGDLLECHDTRGKKRQLRVVEVDQDFVLLNTHKTTYMGTGTKLHCGRDLVGTGTVGTIPPIQQVLRLKPGDELLLMRKRTEGQPALRDPLGRIIRPARISCTSAELFNHLEPGVNLLFDDGKIRAEIKEKHPDHVLLRIMRAKFKGTRLGPDKGINIPGEDLEIRGLTQKDREDLRFIVKHADIVNFSFVNTATDVQELIDELKEIGAGDDLGVIFKIETQQGYTNLKDILLAGMQLRHFGVMIARGDLAVETGWENIGRIQSEILAHCAAAHVPVVWATQVLENLAKKGLPSRSEITDAISSLKAECVMLNKGDFIMDAISFLDRILCDMERYHAKSEHMLPSLEEG